MWVATTTGRVFVSQNADAAAGSVTFTRIDTASTPGRFVSGVYVDPGNPNRAYQLLGDTALYAASAWPRLLGDLSARQGKR